jgi:hypothetical protein
MRTLTFVLSCAFFLIGPSLAGSPEAGLPGLGTFSYNGSPATADAPPPIVVAIRS